MVFVRARTISSLIRGPNPDLRVTRGLTRSLLTPRGAGAPSLHLLIGCCPPPLPFSPWSRCFLRILSLFLYQHLIQRATRALSGSVSHPAAFGGDESCQNGEEGGVTTQLCRLHRCSLPVSFEPRSSRPGGVVEFTWNPVLRHFRAVPRLRIPSQPPAAIMQV